MGAGPKKRLVRIQHWRDEKRYLHARADRNRKRQIHAIFQSRGNSGCMFGRIYQYRDHKGADEDVAEPELVHHRLDRSHHDLAHPGGRSGSC
jgi:hypothetical protein